MSKELTTFDGNEAAASVAYRLNEVCAIYPITPSSPMGEFSDEWSSLSKPNIWGTVPHVVELQSEGGASGAVHGSLQAGAMTTTFTASQGLLLMIPNMFKIAGELTSTVFHVSARSVATHALSIFGDHSDVMAARSTGWAMLCSSSIQEVHDMALISQAATLESRIPFLHFFDGFRSSHELQKVEVLSDDVLKAMIDDELVFAHRQRALSPNHPIIRGTAQNPDVFFQAREACNPFYEKVPAMVEKAMKQFAELTGRSYKLFDYFGAEDAEKVIILMGSGAETAREAVEYMVAQGEKVGMIQVHLYRPFSAEHFLGAVPATANKLTVLDRTKEPGAAGDPLYQDVLTVLGEALLTGERESIPQVVGGRYGLSSKEFTPAMVKGVFDNMDAEKPLNKFSVGIKDDVTNNSLSYDPAFITESDDVIRAMFYGLGSDGTVGANKNSIKIIASETDYYTQGYFVYDSKKSGSRTISHLRFGSNPIRSTYLIQSANFIGCHQFNFLDQVDVLKHAAEGATFLLNSTHGTDEVWDALPKRVQQQMIDRKLKFYVIDGYKVAQETGMGARINTIMQTCFFAISGVLPKVEAIEKIKNAIKKTYGKKGDAIVQQNYKAVDQTLEHLHEVSVPAAVSSSRELPPVVSDKAPEFVRNVTSMMMADRGDELPVSAMPVDGTFPTGTTKWEKRDISLQVPVWDPDVCTQCGTCVMVCPHSVVRAKTFSETEVKDAPDGFITAKARGKDIPEDRRYALVISAADCTGCALCTEICPAKNKEEVGKKALNMADKTGAIAQDEAFGYFLTLPENSRENLNLTLPKDVQFIEPLFEFSGACAGCGETPYVKMISQFFGDRMVVANATGCSSIYGGNLPTTPWSQNAKGQGPAWSNSLFEDNAEFGFGFRLSIDKHKEFARELVKDLSSELGDDLVEAILTSPQKTQAEIDAQRERVDQLRAKLKDSKDPKVKQLMTIADNLVERSVWILGGDGWAYDIGYGGLDHVLASGRNVNVLVMDTEVYSNTGGQMSKATPTGAVAKFAAGGKDMGKKDLGMIAMSYGNIYVARVAMGANPRQCLRAFQEAEAFDGPSLIIAYSHCIAHGIDMKTGLRQQKLAVDSGHWVLCRYNPDLIKEEKNPMQLDCKKPSIPLEDYIYNEIRYKMLTRSRPETAKALLVKGQAYVNERWKMYEKMASETV